MSQPGRSPLLSDEVVDLLGSGGDYYVATRDAELNPESMFGAGIWAHSDRARITVYLPSEPPVLAAKTLENLALNQHIAVTVSLPTIRAIT